MDENRNIAPPESGSAIYPETLGFVDKLYLRIAALEDDLIGKQVPLVSEAREWARLVRACEGQERQIAALEYRITALALERDEWQAQALSSQAALRDEKRQCVMLDKGRPYDWLQTT